MFQFCSTHCREISPPFSPSFALCPEFSSAAKNSLQNIHLGDGHFPAECGISETVLELESAIVRQINLIVWAVATDLKALLGTNGSARKAGELG